MASVRASERDPKSSARTTGRGGVVDSEAVKAPLAPLGAVIAHGAHGSSKSAAESWTLSWRFSPAPPEQRRSAREPT